MKKDRASFPSSFELLDLILKISKSMPLIRAWGKQRKIQTFSDNLY